MRLSPSRPLRRAPALRDAAFTDDSRLHGIVLRMITLNSLSAFAQEISRRPPVEPVRSVSPTPPAPGPGSETQRRLEAVPPQPVRPVPRGSLLDLRV